MKNYSALNPKQAFIHATCKRFILIAIIFFLQSNIILAQCPNMTLPVPVCHPELAISLNNKGMALVPAHFFDNGSHDNGCDIWFKIKRMTAPVNYDCYSSANPNYMFHDSLKLCCGDVGDTIKAILRVYDVDPGNGPVTDDTLRGNFNDCMIDVYVIDKIAPVITCPPDVTIECGFTMNDLDTLGMPTIVENCDSILIEIEIDSQGLTACRVGELKRKFIVTDGSGLKDSCIQTVTIENNYPFDGDDPNQLMWPPDTMVFDCMAVVDTSITGYPKIIEDECDLVGVDFEDELFEFSKNGACYKIIRKWIVIDWCQHVPGIRNPYTADNGYWTHEQFIKVKDTIAPVLNGPRDTIVDNFSPNCGPVYVNLPVATAEDCDNIDPIEFSIQIDYDNDGSIDTSFAGNDGSGLFNNGIHRVDFLGKDRCGNIGVLSILVTVRDRQLPSPVSKNGIIIVLAQMGNNIMASLNARLLNASSYDNCTPQECLKYSFSPDVNDTIRIFGCDSAGIRNVEFWVTDKEGNQDFARTFVNVEDNQGICPSNVNTTSIYGRILNNDLNGINQVLLELKESSSNMTTNTDNDGHFAFNDVEMGNTYQLKPSKSDDPKNGLTTKDLLIIQKHILGIDEITNPYDIIAADVNKSGDISTRDIVQLRKLILGKINSFQHGHSWRFVLSGYKFPEPTNPLLFGFPESYMMHNIKDVMNVKFDAIKIGDVNGSNSYVNIQNRSNEDDISISWIKSSSELTNTEWMLSINEDVDIEGLEMSLTLPSNILSIEIEGLNLPLFNRSNYNYDNESRILRISWIDPEGVSLFADQNLLKLNALTKENTNYGFDLNTSPMKGMAYTTLSKDLNLKYDNTRIVVDGSIDEIKLFQNAPNPFSNETSIEFYLPNSSKVKLSILNSFGEQVYSQEKTVEAGSSQWLVDDLNLWPSGIYFYTIEADGEKHTNRMIYMKD